MNEKYRIEYVYKIWDNVTGDNVCIQEGDEKGLYLIGCEAITVEQIPGIIQALTELKTEYDREYND